MAQLQGGFDPSTVKSNSVLPAGTYKLAITKTSAAPSKKNPDNTVYTLEMDVQDGQYQGRKLFTRLNLVHDNQTTKDIAQRELKGIVEACGLPALKADLDELLGIPFMGDVVIEVSKDPQYDDSNRVKKYYPAQSGILKVLEGQTSGPWATKAGN